MTAGDGVWIAVIGGARVVPLALLGPLLGGRWSPLSARISLIAGCAWLVVSWYWLAGHGEVPGEPTGAPVGLQLHWQRIASSAWEVQALAFVTEIVRGVTIAFAVALLILAARAGFQLLGQGLAGPRAPHARVATVSEIGALLAMACFFALDGHLMVLRAVSLSYRVAPLGASSGSPGIDALPSHLIAITGHFFEVALRIAAPVLVTGVLAQLLAGLIGRVHPRLLGAGGSSLGPLAGLLLLAGSAAAIAVLWTEELAAWPEVLKAILE